MKKINIAILIAAGAAFAMAEHTIHGSTYTMLPTCPICLATGILAAVAMALMDWHLNRFDDLIPFFAQGATRACCGALLLPIVNIFTARLCSCEISDHTILACGTYGIAITLLYEVIWRRTS